jgi:hypothetical protein
MPTNEEMLNASVVYVVDAWNPYEGKPVRKVLLKPIAAAKAAAKLRSAAYRNVTVRKVYQ